jgi:1-acyl-sn-glycerol-3-phosphate acyltransferase
MDRINCVYKTGRALTSLYLKARYNLHFEGDLPKTPFILLPKHQQYKDIILEGLFIHDRLGVSAYWIMRPLPLRPLLEMYGGIVIARAKEIKKGKYDKEKGKEINQTAIQKTINVLEKGEIVVIHPEGTRSPNKMRPIRIAKDSVIDRIIQEKKDTIPFIPLGIQYEGKNITLRSGQPIFTKETGELEEKISKELQILSNIH